jgi:CRP/FNR family transcriptional regulator, anaerobic regulatory protein
MLAQDTSIISLNTLKLHKNQPAALRHLVTGQPLFHEGDVPSYLYEIVSGTVKVSKCTAGGRSLILNFFIAGDVIGLTLMDRYAYSAVALEPVTVRCVSRRRLESDMESEGSSARQLLTLACAEIEALQSHLLLVSLLDPRGRLAAFLCRLAERQDDTSDIHLPMTQREIAEHLALTPETVCRVLRQFRESGWIDMPDCHKVVLRNHHALEQLAEDDEG